MVIEGHKYYYCDNFDYGNLCIEYIPEIYHLLDLFKDDESNGLGI